MVGFLASSGTKASMRCALSLESESLIFTRLAGLSFTLRNSITFTSFFVKGMENGYISKLKKRYAIVFSMAQRRMFAEYFKEEIEPTKKIDRALLAAIGVKAYPYFKFTGGEHSVVVLGFKQKRKMYIQRDPT